MPTYTYRCKSCGHHFDEWQKISDEPLVTCPSCNSNTLARVIAGGAGLIFKGSGFYLTDYKKNGSKNKADTPEETKPAGEQKQVKDSGKTEKT